MLTGGTSRSHAPGREEKEAQLGRGRRQAVVQPLEELELSQLESFLTFHHWVSATLTGYVTWGMVTLFNADTLAVEVSLVVALAVAQEPVVPEGDWAAHCCVHCTQPQLIY